MIQLTTNDRCITENRGHIKPTSVTADAYFQYQSNKQSNIKNRPLTDILNNINKNPTAYAKVQTPNVNISDGQYHEQIIIIKNKRQNKRNNVLKGQMSVTRKEPAFQCCIIFFYQLTVI